LRGEGGREGGTTRRREEEEEERALSECGRAYSCTTIQQATPRKTQ